MSAISDNNWTTLLQHTFYCQPDYLVRLRPRPGTDAIHKLRGALKMLLRRYNLQAVKIEEIKVSGLAPLEQNYTATPK
jgi:hypothetical protein